MRLNGDEYLSMYAIKCYLTVVFYIAVIASIPFTVMYGVEETLIVLARSTSIIWIAFTVSALCFYKGAKGRAFAFPLLVIFGCFAISIESDEEYHRYLFLIAGALIFDVVNLAPHYARIRGWGKEKENEDK